MLKTYPSLSINMYFPREETIHLEHTEILLEAVTLFIVTIILILSAITVIYVLIKHVPKKLNIPVKYSALSDESDPTDSTVFLRSDTLTRKA